MPFRPLVALALAALLAAPARAQSSPPASPPAGPGLVEMRGAWRYTATRDVAAYEVLVPLPLDDREQVPLTLDLGVAPAELLRGARVRTDELGNRVAVLALAPLEAGAAIDLAWTSVVLVGERDLDDLPESARFPAEWPAEARPWLASTRYVQADAPEIRAVAAELGGARPDVRATIAATLERAREIYAGQEGRCTDLGAVQALKRQGSCTSCANLVAALLRASGIPARILAGYPTWSGPLQTHYVVEAWVPGFGWYALESTLLQAGWAPWRQLQVAIVPPEHEGQRADSRFFAGAGVPYLSLTELDGVTGGLEHRGTVDEAKNCDHEARMLRRLDGKPAAWSKALADARRRWRAWLATEPTAPPAGRLATKLERADVENADDLIELRRALR